MLKLWKPIVLLLAIMLIVPAVLAQDTTEAESPAIPSSYLIAGAGFEFQGWNNCGPATLTNALTVFGYGDNQNRAALWLKPNYEDKNVSPWQMVDFVNTQVPELPVYAVARAGGTIDLLKELIANDFPVIIEKGYDPEPDRLGWMGHYLLMVGYDDATGEFITHDSYIGSNTRYTYDFIENFWQHFNYTYVTLYEVVRQDELVTVLGDDFDEEQNYANALEIARAEAIAQPENAFAWFNMGTNFLALGMYQEAAIAYDEARRFGLPWRMLWYQFGPYEAYYQVGRYDDMIALAQASLNDGGGQFVEETYYYGGLAREGRGELQRALSNYNSAIQFNPNFLPAQEARDRVSTLMSN